MTDVAPEKPKVVNLRSGAPHVSEIVVESETVTELEKLLAAARAGELIGMAVVLQFRDNSSSERLTGRIWSMSTIGELEYLKHHIMVRYHADEPDVDDEPPPTKTA